MIHKQLLRTQASFLFRIGVLGGVFASFLAAQIEHSRSILHSKEFISNPSLLAHARQTVLVDSNPNPFEEPVIRYELEGGAHDFCLSGTRTDLKGMTLKEMFGEKVFTLPSYERCSRVELPGGIYELQFVHPGKHRPGPNRSIRVQVDPPNPPLVDANGDPVPGWWAAQNDPAEEPQHRLGRLRAQTPFKDLFNNPYLYSPFVVDYTSRQIDEFSLFQMHRDSNRPVILGVPSAGETTGWTGNEVTGHPEVQGLYVVNDRAGCIPFCDNQLLYISDLGNQRFKILQQDARPYYQIDQNSNSSQLGWNGPTPPGPQVFELLFRFFPDGGQLGTLRPGEAALFQACGYQGKAAIFAPGEFALSAYDTPTITIDNSAKSVRLGNNTAMEWVSPSSQLTAIVADTACLPAGSAAPSGNDLEVLPLDSLLADSSRAAALDKKCINCKLRGINLANLDLDGWDFSGADLSGATLTHVQLRNTKLDGAVLTGTKFSCIDVSGADGNHPTDLTSMDFTKFQWVATDGCKSNFSYTLLSIAKLPPASWKYLNLSYATFVDANGQQLSSEAHPLDLSGATLTGVSLQGAILDYATGLPNADLTRAVLSGVSLRHVNLSHAVLDGAQLNNANLDNANLSAAHFIKPSPDGAGANLQGAFLRNVNLSQGKLSGADLTNANFYSSIAVGVGLCIPDEKTGFTADCATASHATMDGTHFNSAYLFGVDFTGATAQGVNFGNSFLTGANFAGATLSADTSGSDTGFSGAFLQGTNLGGVILQNGISLQNAFVDFSAGNTITLILGGEHTTFSGYWNKPGQPVCAQMVYTQPTTVPQTDGNVTCPKGFRYPSGCGPATPDGSNLHWKSLVDVSSSASYATNATYTPASSQPICQYDPKWIPLGSSLPGQNRASRHRPGRGKRP
jgi:uncharacterized protein YjbI with pentapeptide repeats